MEALDIYGLAIEEHESEALLKANHSNDTEERYLACYKLIQFLSLSVLYTLMHCLQDAFLKFSLKRSIQVPPFWHSSKLPILCLKMCCLLVNRSSEDRIYYSENLFNNFSFF